MAQSTPGYRSKQLVNELRRASSNGSLFLPRYDEDGVRMVLRESTELNAQIEENMGGAPNTNNLPDAVKSACQVRVSSSYLPWYSILLIYIYVDFLIGELSDNKEEQTVCIGVCRAKSINDQEVAMGTGTSTS